MQTFLTSRYFIQAAVDLDSTRLNKQLREGLQMLSALQHVKLETSPHGWSFVSPHDSRWRNHKCTRMWERSAHSLAEYCCTMYIEFRRRGGNDRVGYLDQVRALIARDGWDLAQTMAKPWWLVDDDAIALVTACHRSALLCKAEWKALMTGKDDDMRWYRERASLGRWTEQASPDCVWTYAWPDSAPFTWNSDLRPAEAA